ncbi:caspase family protein [Ekhidna sp.]|uniref:caspase family protein n=1 Tax=Ekhidna sp. TaxID=2608089 RepID=UPI003CCBBF37
MRSISILFLTILFFNAFAQGELIIRQGHTAAINMVKYSPSGKYIYSASDDKTIKMWDVFSGIDINTFNAHEAEVLSIDLSENGSKLISGDAEGYVIVWDALTGEMKQKIKAHDGAANTAKFSSDTKMYLTGGDDAILKLWDSNGDTIKTIQGFKAPIKNLAISPSGDRIVTGGGKNNGVEVKLIDPEKGKILADALDNVKGSGAALAYTKVLMTGFAVIGNAAAGRKGKDLTTIFVITYPNIEFTNDGKKVLFSSNIYIPFTTEKGEEEDNGSSSVQIIDIAEDRNNFGQVSRPNMWTIPHSRGVGVFNKEQTKVIVNEKTAIKVYDVENADFPEPGTKDARQYVPPVVQEIKNIPSNTNWLGLSPNYRTIVTSDDNRQLKLWDYKTGRKIKNLEGYVQPATSVDVLPDGKHILVGSKNRNMTLWDYTSGQLVKVFDRSENITSIDVSKDGRYFATTNGSTYSKVWNFKSGRQLRSFKEKNDNTVWIKFDEDDKDKVYVQQEDGQINEWSIQDIKSKKSKITREEIETKYDQNGYSISFDGLDLSIKKGGQEVISDKQQGLITDAVLSVDGKFVITTNESGEIALYSLEERKKKASMTLVGESGFITYTPDFYYMSSKSAAKAIAFKSGNKVLPVEQLELKYNRPDKVSAAIGYSSQRLIDSYKAAFKKRLARLGYTEADLAGNNELPVVEVDYLELPLETKQRSLTIPVKASDNQSTIHRLQVYINDVPVYGSNGKKITPSQKVDQSLTFDLSSGLNEIKITAINAKGAESIPSTFEVKYTADFDRPNLYIVSIGVSKYQQSDYNLAFAAKDAADLVETLKASSAYSNVYDKIITNEHATDTNILAAKEFIKQAKVDDIVIVFIAGHGVLDDEYNYYFGTHNMDFTNPSSGGLSYASLQSLIDEIPSRNKLLMMDTCHSGELDEEDVEEANEEISSAGSVAFRAAGKLIKIKENSFGLENTLELSKSLFGDMKKGTGATVVSAAGGTEFAAEGVNSQNGLFTGCLIQGLTNRRADLNRDRSYTVSEIRDYVSEQVIRLSRGKQVPTSREENIKNDFRIY